MKLSEMRQALAGSGIRLTKSLGQNFLHDANQLRRIVAAADLSGADKVLEIGPGLGPLTELLLAEAGEVLAIEKDARLVEVLKRSIAGREREELSEQDVSSSSSSSILAVPLERPEDRGRRREREREHGAEDTQHAAFTLLQADALELLRGEPRDWSDWKVVSNLPYSVASPIVVELAQTDRGPERIVVTLQLEVARRLMARPGGADYGLLTLLVQLYYEPKQFFKIPASCFFPEPDVDSACVCLVRRRQPLLAAAQRPVLVRIVKRSFSQRRKMMLKLLKADWPAEKLESALEQLQLSPQTRAETVSLEQFVRLTKALAEEKE